MTTTHRVGLCLTFIAADPRKINFQALLDRLYPELLATEERESDITDPDLAASLADLTVEIEMGVEAEYVIDAQLRAIVIVRTALHAIEVGTPGWEATIAGITSPTRLDLQDA